MEKKSYIAPECMEIGKFTSMTKASNQGDVYDGLMIEISPGVTVPDPDGTQIS